MGNTILGKRPVRSKFVFLFLICGILILAKVDSGYALTKTEIASGLNRPRGLAIDEANDHLYFVEYDAGTLKRIQLLPTPPPYTIDMIATGFNHPEDVELDLDHGCAYVTERHGAPLSGLWKVNISTGVKTLITFNAGKPQQLVLDLAHDQAFTVGRSDGRLRSIDLTTGAKSLILDGLNEPIGLAVTDDGNYAYVSEWAIGDVSKIDLTTGLKVGIVATGLTKPYYLAWTDPSQNSLYVAEGAPVNKVSRIDLMTSATYDAITGLPPEPQGILVRMLSTPVYVSSDSEITRVDMIDLTGPVFMGVGHVPATEIVDGYATTDPSYFFHVHHSPFGGTLNIFGNLINFRALGATHYKVLVSKDGGPSAELNLSWNMYKWNAITSKYDLTPIAPESGAPFGTAYRIPLEGDHQYHPEFWYPPFLFMRWPSGGDGLYTFEVEIYDEGAMSPATPISLPPALNSLTLRVDNTPHDVEIVSIWQSISGPDVEIQPCDIVSTPDNKYYFRITAYDPNHHLLNYRLTALWGKNQSALIGSDSYSAHVDAEGPYLWSGIINAKIPATTWGASCNCAHTFYLRSWKRTINGYNYIIHRDYHKSITINNTGVTCP